VIRGKIANEIFIVEPGDDYIIYRAGVLMGSADWSEKSYDLDEIGNGKPIGSGVYFLGTGSYYTMTCDTFHQVNPIETLSTSIVVQHKRIRDSAFVLAPNSYKLFQNQVKSISVHSNHNLTRF
jgi:hypothetical protein